METGKQNKKVGVFLYELIGTAFIMFTFMVTRAYGYEGYPARMTFAMMVVNPNFLSNKVTSHPLRNKKIAVLIPTIPAPTIPTFLSNFEFMLSIH